MYTQQTRLPEDLIGETLTGIRRRVFDERTNYQALRKCHTLQIVGSPEFASSERPGHNVRAYIGYTWPFFSRRLVYVRQEKHLHEWPMRDKHRR